jgi:hypothetical protein
MVVLMASAMELPVVMGESFGVGAGTEGALLV